ncbi:MAG: hypothetical protein Q8Q54_14245 [Methylococcales bacterium]|nr:hypothetical protein [Methylococcales bacterium]MDP3840074.1 hypothetical protein [Methylococcales bacterium]
MQFPKILLLAATLVPTLCHADCQQNAVIANQFINSYIKYNNAVYQQKTQESVLEWLQKNKTVTPHFTQSYQQLLAQAEKADPELGLDFDPILDAQDYPEQGMKIASCDEQSGLITLVGKDKAWENFKVVVNVLDKRVDGAGVINIPKDKQASR